MSNNFKYISLLEEHELVNNVVLPFKNEEGLSCILIKNDKKKEIANIGKTDCLEYHLNTVVERNSQKFYVHIIICNKNDAYANEQFKIAYEYLFKEIKNPISDFELNILIQSFETLFKVSSDKDIINLQTGIYGELLTLYYLYENGCYKVFNKYHKNFFSKHDLEFDSFTRMEVKSSVGTKRIHSFSHDQLMRTDVNVIVSSVLFEEATEGLSLFDFFNKILSVTSNPDLFLMIGRLKAMCGVSAENKGVCFSFEKALNDIRFYNSKSLPHIDKSSYDGIFNIKYDVDCSTTNYLNVSDLISELNSILEHSE